MPATMARKKTGKSGDRSADRHKHKTIAYRPPPHILEALEKVRAQERRRSVTEVVGLAVEDWLIGRGLLPPLPTNPEEGGA
jgi:hypothetical protein